MIARLAAVAIVTVAAAAPAQARDYCSTRPSIGQSACVLDAGRVAVETALLDWEREMDDGSAEDRFLVGDTLLRIGLTDRVEAQIGWTPLGIVRTRETGAVRRDHGVGDLSVGARINLRNPDGKGLSIGLQPSLTLPVGSGGIGDGAWSAELIVPVSVDLSDVFNLQFSPTIAAAADEGGEGRHLAYGNVLGLGMTVADGVAVTLEALTMRDDDPVDPTTQVAAAAAVGWMATGDLQFDAGGVFGLNHATPDARLYGGISYRF